MEAIGIFIGLVGLIWDCSDRCKNNAASFENLERDYRSLVTLLHQVEMEVPHNSLPDPIREGCRQIAMDIEKMLKEYGRKGSRRNANPLKLFKRTLADIEQLRSRLIAQVVILHTSTALSSPRTTQFEIQNQTVSTTISQVPLASVSDGVNHNDDDDDDDDRICRDVCRALQVSTSSHELKEAVRNSLLRRPANHVPYVDSTPIIVTSPSSEVPPGDTYSLAEVSSCGSSFSMSSGNSSTSFGRREHRSLFTSKKSRFVKAAINADTQTLLELQASVDRDIVRKALLEVIRSQVPISAQIDIVRLLLSLGADTECCDSSHRRTPLIWAIISRRPDLVSALLGAGARLETRDGRRHNTPLIWAVYADDSAAIRRLIKKGSQMNIADTITGHGPLILAAHLGHLDSSRTILEEDRQLILSRDNSGYTPLAIAYLNRNSAMAELYLRFGDDVDFLWPAGSRLSLLSMAIMEGQTDFAGLLVDKGARVASINGFPALTVAVRQQSIPMVEILLQSLPNDTAALENRDTKGGTALLWAIWLKNERIVGMLVDAGADTSAKDGNDVSAQHWARWTERPGIIALVARSDEDRVASRVPLPG